MRARWSACTITAARWSMAAEGAEDITGLALDLGFSSHSHFTDVFRREFGSTPSEIRKRSLGADLREMSKNLIV
jgi:AraC-like DNA-binding protein